MAKLKTITASFQKKLKQHHDKFPIPKTYSNSSTVEERPTASPPKQHAVSSQETAVGNDGAQDTNANPQQSLPSSESHPVRPFILGQGDNDVYVVEPTHELALRVSKQYMSFRDILGFEVHPTISSALPPYATIADINTGNGIWMHHLNGKRPFQYHLVGYDTRTELFPGQAPGTYLLPLSNVQFRDHHILRDFPERDHGKFDMVYVQFLATTLVGSQWDKAFHNVMALLKPGGWLQWLDCDLSTTTNRNRVYISKPSASKNGFGAMLDGLEQVERHYDITEPGCKRLKEIASRHPDVEHMDQEIFNTAQDSEIRKKIDTLNVHAWKRLLVTLLEVPDSGWDLDKIAEVVQAVADETADGTYIPLDIYVTTAKKHGRLWIPPVEGGPSSSPETARTQA